MTININGKNYEIIFGVGFVRTMDTKYFVRSTQGVKFGVGLETTVPKLLDKDAVTLSDYLYEGTCTETDRPTQAEIDSFIDHAEDIDKLFADVVDELKKSNASKAKFTAAEKNYTEAKAEEEARKKA